MFKPLLQATMQGVSTLYTSRLPPSTSLSIEEMNRFAQTQQQLKQKGGLAFLPKFVEPEAHLNQLIVYHKELNQASSLIFQLLLKGFCGHVGI